VALRRYNSGVVSHEHCIEVTINRVEPGMVESIWSNSLLLIQSSFALSNSLLIIKIELI
jgi:hypothetical protein